MPEGPEVKVIADQLKSILTNKFLTDFKVHSGKYLDKCKLENLEIISKLFPLKIIDIKTKGKLIYFILEKNWVLFNTLGMSGSWSKERKKHCHIELNYKNNEDIMDNIWFCDIRRFGNLTFMNNTELINKKLNSLGPDMLSNPPSVKEFINIYRKKNKWNICKALMDQSLVSGCGNYIKSEVLYDSNNSPYSIINELNDKKLTNIYRSFIKIINESYKNNGTSMLTYKDVNNKKGNYLLFLKIYKKKTTHKGEHVMKSITPDKRSTYWVNNQ
jgi:endonuclease-8